MTLHTLQEIERAIDGLTPEELAELYTWLERHRPSPVTATVFEQGFGLFGSPEDSTLLDEVVHTAYEERRRPTRQSAAPGE